VGRKDKDDPDAVDQRLKDTVRKRIQKSEREPEAKERESQQQEDKERRKGKG